MYQSSFNDVFRFTQIRKAQGKASDLVTIDDRTQLSQKLISATSSAEKRDLADAYLEQNSAEGAIENLSLYKSFAPLLDASRVAPRDHKKFITLITQAAQNNKPTDLKRQKKRLSDIMLASVYATRPPRNVDRTSRFYALYHLVEVASEGGTISKNMLAVLSRPVFLPKNLTHPTGRKKQVPDDKPRTTEKPPETIDGMQRLQSTIEELSTLKHSTRLIRLKSKGTASEPASVLSEAARSRLSETAGEILASKKLDPSQLPVDEIIAQLTSDLSALAKSHLRKFATARTTTYPPQIQESFDAGLAPKVEPIGVADLLVTKQQIKRYELSEIAHVQNVMAGEKHARSHRRLNRLEETWARETEQTTETENELHSTDRFELNRETSRTIRNDYNVGFGLSLSGKYGPSVEFNSNLSSNQSQSSENHSRNASEYAREVVNRSVERVAETVREQRTLKIVREVEETNLHELTNESGANRRGVYQFIDKIYETQVYNYGVRQMFEFMVPEPASFLWHLEANPDTGLTLPDPPPPIESIMPYANNVVENLYPILAMIYQATDIDPPPAQYKTTSGGTKVGETNASEKGQPHNVHSIDLAVPDGYQAIRGTIAVAALTDNVQDLTITISIGHQIVLWNPLQKLETGKIDVAAEPGIPFDLSEEPYDLTADSKLNVQIVANETASHTVTVNVVCERTEYLMRTWRMATFDKLMTAYQDRKKEYEQRVEQLKQASESEIEQNMAFGAPPSQNLVTILQELKKHCLSIAIGESLAIFDAIQEHEDRPPEIDYQNAYFQGMHIRFFEQAFEWDQMQYVFYPYFWARKETWADRFLRQDSDPVFRDFLRAGSARVVVPVRPGFESVVNHFFMTGQIWNGDDKPPLMGDDCYLPIIEEIMERRDAPQNEISIGEAWEVRLPTSLVALRMNDKMPTWRRTDRNEWKWQAVPEDSAETGPKVPPKK